MEFGFMKSDKFSSSLTKSRDEIESGSRVKFFYRCHRQKKEPQKCVKDMKNVVKHRKMNMKAKNLQHKRKEISFRYFYASFDFPIHKFCMFLTFRMLLRARWGFKSAAGCPKFSPPKTKALKWHFNRSRCFEWKHVEHKFYVLSLLVAEMKTFILFFCFPPVEEFWNLWVLCCTKKGKKWRNNCLESKSNPIRFCISLRCIVWFTVTGLSNCKLRLQNVITT